MFRSIYKLNAPVYSHREHYQPDLGRCQSGGFFFAKLRPIISLVYMHYFYVRSEMRISKSFESSTRKVAFFGCTISRIKDVADVKMQFAICNFRQQELQIFSGSRSSVNWG